MIVRTPHRERFTIINNGALEDERLSWRARGLLAYLLSKPDWWEVLVGHLTAAAPTGRTIVRATLQELEDAGYIVRTGQCHRSDGTFDAPQVQVLEYPQVEQFSQVTTGGDLRTRSDLGKGPISPGHDRGRFTDRGSTVDGKSPTSKEGPSVKTDKSSSGADLQTLERRRHQWVSDHPDEGVPVLSAFAPGGRLAPLPA